MVEREGSLCVWGVGCGGGYEEGANGVVPFFSMIVKSNPKAGNGVKISENMMTPSTPNERQGCNDNSIAMSGVSERCRNGYFSEY